MLQKYCLSTEKHITFPELPYFRKDNLFIYKQRKLIDFRGLQKVL